MQTTSPVTLESAPWPLSELKSATPATATTDNIHVLPETLPSPKSPIAAEEHQSMVNSQDNSFLLDKSTFFREVTCSTFVKTLLICSAALYIAHEITNVVLSLLNFYRMVVESGGGVRFR